MAAVFDGGGQPRFRTVPLPGDPPPPEAPTPAFVDRARRPVPDLPQMPGTYTPGVPRPLPQLMDPSLWGEILQRPNMNGDLSGPGTRQAMWGQRLGDMAGADSTGLASLNTALAAGRDKALADYIAAHTPQAGGGGGGGGGGGRGGRHGGGGGAGGNVGGGMYTPVDNGPSWVDQLVGSMPPPDQTPTYSPIYGAPPRPGMIPIPHLGTRAQQGAVSAIPFMGAYRSPSRPVAPPPRATYVPTPTPTYGGPRVGRM